MTFVAFRRTPDDQRQVQSAPPERSLDEEAELPAALLGLGNSGMLSGSNSLKWDFSK